MSPFPTQTLSVSASSDDALVGRVIAGKFSLLECIGVGASGTVYKALQTSLGRTVAVKVLRPELAGDPRFIKRFHDEAQAASRLNHPNVVSVIDFGQTEDGLLYLVMEFLRGVTLTHTLRTQTLGNERICEIGRQILSALEEAHESGVVHADLKSDNTMIDHRRSGWDLVKVVDFGIARLIGGVDVEENIVDSQSDMEECISGTPEYMAPEIIQGEEPTPATDIYAVGCLLYELIVGQTPFSGFSTIEVLKHQIKAIPTPPSQFETGFVVATALESAVLKSLSKKPRDRFASAREFADALHSSFTAVENTEQRQVCCQCSYVSSVPFKFCPECGGAKSTDYDFELDVDSEEWTTDGLQTADLDPLTVQKAFAELQEASDAQCKPDIAIKGFQVGTLQEKDHHFIPIAKGQMFPLPLLGRDNDRIEIASFLTEDQELGKGALCVSGVQGSGVTRLFSDALSASKGNGTTVYQVESDPSGLGQPYYPIRQILSLMLQLPQECDYAGLGTRLENIGLSKRDLPGVAELLRLEGSSLVRLDRDVRKRELLASVTRVIRKVGENEKAVLLFEDCHLYDQPSKELLRELIVANTQSPVCRILLGTSDADSIDLENTKLLRLEGFTESHLQQVLTHLASQGHPDLLTLGELKENTTGKPFQVETLIRYSAEGGCIEDAPTGLADLIAARLDFLPQVAKYVLQAMSIFGIRANRLILEKILSDSCGKVEFQAAVKLLLARELIFVAKEELVFFHGFVKDVVYESTPLDVRRTLHQVACGLLSAFSDDPLLLGYHAERAGEDAKASRLLSNAGDLLVLGLDDLGATSVYNRALSVTRSLLFTEEEGQTQFYMVEIAIKLANCLRRTGEVSLARGILDEVDAYGKESPALHAQLLRAMAQLQATKGKVKAAIALYKKAISHLIPIFALELLTDTYLDLAVMQIRDDRSAVAIGELEEAIDLISAGEGMTVEEAPENFWRILLRLSQLYFVQGDTKKARPLAQHAARLADGVTAPVGVARSYATLAGIFEACEEPHKAQEHRIKAIESMRALGDRRTTAELLLSSTSPSQTVHGISIKSVREARILAQEVGWDEGVRRTDDVQNH